jgi:hypothetical protein
VAERTKPLFQNRAELVRRLIMAEIIAHRGEGPLAPRFPIEQLRRALRAQALEAERAK